ncbi:MAG TPA: gamma-glutamyl-gamma-aminobutyrate hydrolase family protein [Burkholderiales bacterium]|jgi:putative glutamine amidotransferase|nr:gamma-glutamyl-gamma-aminobutyrate hydrolase family protein [Burkholderiales bacterium]
MPRRDRPLIGLTTYGRTSDGRFTLPAEYVDCVRRAGAVPVLLAPGEPHWQAVLGEVDAFILTGGGDVDPDRYGGRRHETNYGVDSERDALELAVARSIIDTGLPTLGICRGAQILNIVQGGTLIEHIPEEVGERVLHRAPPREPVPHPIAIKPGSRLMRIFQRTQCEVTSWHHQAPRKVADGFEVVATAPDGIVEAIEMPDHPWLVAVQWHPELSAAADPLQQRLFDALVEAARQR